MGKTKDAKTNSTKISIPKTFKAGTVDKLTFALKKFGDQQIHGVFFFNGRFDKTRLKKAVRMVLDIEPTLGCKFIEHPKKPYWERRDDLDSLDYITFVDSTDFDKDLFDYIITPCDPREDLGVQVRIFHQEKNDVLCIKTNHAIIDGGGCVEYLQLLRKVYQKLAQNPEFEFEVNISGSRSLKQVLRRFNIFQKIFIFFKNMSSKPNWMFPHIGLEALKPNYIIRRIPPERFRKIKKFGKEFGATINDMTLTAFYRAIFQILNPEPMKKLVTVLTINLRAYLPEYKGESICNLSSSAYPELDYIPNEPFKDTLMRVRDEMKFRKKYAPGIGPAFFIENVFRLPFERVKQSIQDRYDKDLKRKATHPVFTNVGLITTEDLDFGEIKALDGHIMTPIMNAPGFIIGLMTFNETMSLCMGFYESSYDKDIVKKFFDLMDMELTF